MFEETCLPNIGSLKTNISKETFLSKKWKEESLPKNVWTHVCQNLFRDNFSTKNSLNRNLCQPIPAETSTKKLLEEKILPETLWREISTIQCSKRKADQKFWGNYLPNITWKEVSNKKYLKLEFNPNMSEEKNVTKHSVTGNSLPNKLCIKISSKQIPKKPLPKSIWGNMLPKIPWRKTFHFFNQ